MEFRDTILLSDTDEKSHTHKKAESFLSTFNKYVGEGTPVDCLELMTTGWIPSFEAFLTTPQASTKGSRPLSAATAKAKIARLLSCMRIAIKAYAVPNIPVLPGSDRQVEITGLDVTVRKADMLKLITAATGTPRTQQAKADRQHLQLALMGIMLGGIGYQALDSMLRTHLSDDGALYLPHLHLSVKLPERLLTLIHAINSAKAADRRLLFYGDAAAKVIDHEALHTHLTYALRKIGVSDPSTFDNPFVQWLETSGQALIANGLTAHEKRMLIDRYYSYESDAAPGTVAAAQRAIDAIAMLLPTYQTAWHCIRCRGYVRTSTDADRNGNPVYTDQRITGTTLLEGIKSELPELADIPYFAPVNTIIKKVNGRREKVEDPLLRQFLFFRGTRGMADKINRYLLAHRHGYIYGTLVDGRMRYDAVSNAEIHALRVYLGITEAKSFALNDISITKGTRVRVTAGKFEGYEGYVHDLNTHQADATVYVTSVVMRIQGAALTVDYTVSPADLKILSPQ